MTVRLLLTGYKGQVGHCLLRQAQGLGWSVLAVDRDELDITDKLAVLAQAEAFKPHVIINAAAHTAVDKAETDSESSYAINRDGPAYQAQAAVAAGAVLLHISTDLEIPNRSAPASIIASAASRVRMPPEALTPMSGPTV